MNEKILYELPEQRERFVKHFQLENKGTAAAVYPTPVHFEKDGRWEEIDNRLELREENEKASYQNKASAVKVAFAVNADTEAMVSIEKDAHRISWKLERKEKERTASAEPVKFRVLRNEMPQTQSVLQDETGDMAIKKRMAVPNLTSAGVYEGILEDIDLRYTIQGERIKEDITLKSKKAVNTSLIFQIQHPGLAMHQEADGGLGLYRVLAEDAIVTEVGKCGETAEKIYEFQKPYMYDAKDCRCYEVTLSFETLGEESKITVTPDREWLMAEDRVYPVVIDPMTETSKTPDNIEDTYILTGGNDPSEDPNKVYAYGSVVVGRSAGAAARAGHGYSQST